MDLPSFVWSVCPALVVAAPPPGTLERGLAGVGLGSDVGTAVRVAGGGDPLPLLSRTGTALAGRSLVLVTSRMGVLITALRFCSLAAGGRLEELAGSAKMTRFRLDTYSSGNVPACFGLLRRQLGHSIPTQLVHW